MSPKSAPRRTWRRVVPACSVLTVVVAAASLEPGPDPSSAAQPLSQEDAIPSPYDIPGDDRSTVRDNTWIAGAEDSLTRRETLAHLGRSSGLPLVWRATDQREDGTPDGRTARRVIEILRMKREQPFFVAAGSHKHRQPWVAPAELFAQHPIEAVELPIEPVDDRAHIPAVAPTGYPDDADHTDAQKRQAIAAYHATVTRVEHQVGLLLDVLGKNLAARPESAALTEELARRLDEGWRAALPAMRHTDSRLDALTPMREFDL